MDKEKAKNSSIKAALKKLRHPWRLVVVLAIVVIVSIVSAVNVVPAAVSSIVKTSDTNAARASETKSSQPRAWIASYVDGRTSNLRASEMLEVHTEGFSPDAKLEYKYEGADGFSEYSPNTASYSYAYGDERYYAVTGSKAVKKKLKVTVTDTNKSSSTYNKTATATYSNFKAASLQKDLEVSAYGMFVGDSMSLVKLLGSAGILHITCLFSETKQVSINSGDSVSVSGEGNKAVLKALKTGKSTCSVKVAKKKLCSFHSNQSASGNIPLFVFEKPVVTPKKTDTIVVSNTQKGVTYTVNGQSQTCTEDGQELTFTGLQRDTKYSVKCSTEVDGRTAFAYTETKTNGMVRVAFNNNKLGDKTPSMQILEAGSKMSKPDESQIPVAEGYYLDGWYTNTSGEGNAWNFDNDEVEGAMTLYAGWKDIPNTLSINLKKDGIAWTGQKVALYNGMSKAYDLTENNGVYTSSEIANGTYDVYVNGENVNRPVTFDTKATVKDGGQKKESTLEYSSVQIKTTLNDSDSNIPGTVEFRQGAVIWNTFENKDGNISAYALKDGDGESGSIYDIYVGGTKVRETVDASRNSSITLGYYKTQLELTYDNAWKDAVVTLRDEYGNEQHILSFNKADGNKTYYSKIIRADETDSNNVYYLYVGNQNTHHIVKLAQANVQPSDYEKAATFYEASVTVHTDDEPDKFAKVTVDNGTDITELVDNDEDGTYTSPVYKNYSDGRELTYDVKVYGATDENPAKINSSAKSAVVDYYHVETYIKSGGKDVTSTYLVRKNTTISAPASKINNGRKIEGWYTDTGYNTNYNFNKAVTSLLRLYGKFEGQKVDINGYIKTNSSGTQSSDGTYYRMSNLTISGFMTGKVMSGFTLETTGCKNITINADSSLGSFTVMPDSNKSGSVITVEDGKLFVQFNSPITMKDMQKFIRNNVIVQPDSAKEHSMQVTVYGLTD